MKTISLTQNKEMIVDDEDFNLLSVFNWHAATAKDKTYARVRLNDMTSHILKEILPEKEFKYKQYISPTDILMDKPKNKLYVVDHIDRNPLNNQKSNLRVCTTQQNMFNTRKKSKNTFKGVVNCGNKGYVFYSVIQGEIISRHKTELQAAIAYDCEALKRFGEFACTNFPKENYETHTIHPK